MLSSQETAYRVCYACLTYGDEKKRVFQITIALVVPENKVYISVYAVSGVARGGGPPRAALLGGGKIEAIPKNLGRTNYFEGRKF